MIKQNIFALITLAFSFLLYSQEKAEKEQVPGKKTETVSLQNLEFYALQQAYEAEKKTVIIPYKTKLEALLLKYISEYEQIYEEQKKSGNVKGMGIARAGKNIFFAAQEELNIKGNFALPEKVRKDIADSIGSCRKEQEAVMEGIDQKYKDIDDKYRARFVEAYKRLCGEGNAPEEEILTAKFKEFLKTDIKKPETAKTQDANIALLEELGVKVPTEAPKLLSPIIASKGDGSQWVDIGKWTGDMMGMDVVSISLLDKSKDFSETQYLPIASADSKMTYNAIRPMPARTNYAFRLKRVTDARDVDVLEWPSSGNDWRLVVRTRTPQGDETIPLRHAFIFQVSLPESEMGKVFSNTDLDSEKDASKPEQAKTEIRTAPPVKISVLSNPKGAEIYVNDKLYSIKEESVLTPCEITIPSGKYNIRISKFGYLDKSFDNFDAVMKAVVNAELVKDGKLKYYKKDVSANANTWTASGISVKAGDKLVIQVDGVWACAKKSDKCGPAGIPNTTENYKYYSDSTNDLRQEKNIPYGALLMKLGEKGSPMPMDRKTKFTAKESAELFFDINELEGKPRKGNFGSLTVNIGVAPATQSD